MSRLARVIKRSRPSREQHSQRHLHTAVCACAAPPFPSDSATSFFFYCYDFFIPEGGAQLCVAGCIHTSPTSLHLLGSSSELPPSTLHIIVALSSCPPPSPQANSSHSTVTPFSNLVAVSILLPHPSFETPTTKQRGWVFRGEYVLPAGLPQQAPHGEVRI